jgi:hypothetical protein
MPAEQLFQFGVLGVVLGLLLIGGIGGHFWFGRSVTALVDSFREQIAALREQLMDTRKQRDDALRVGVDSATALRELTAVVQALMRQYENEVARQRRRT